MERWPSAIYISPSASQGLFMRDHALLQSIDHRTWRLPAYPGFAITHAAVLVLIGTAWTFNFFSGSTEFIPLHVAAGWRRFRLLWPSSPHFVISRHHTSQRFTSAGINVEK
jgi:hypothetical protein